MIHEMFDLSDREAAAILVKLIKKMRDRASQVETINAVDEGRDFAAFMVGFWNGVNATRLNPWIADREAKFVADVMRKLESRSEEEVIDWLVSRFGRYREEKEASRCRDSV